jgi:hypothetical protein
MKSDLQMNPEPSWLNTSNDRKTPYTEAELDRLSTDFLAMIADTPAVRGLIAEAGKQRAIEIVRRRLAERDTNGLINWQPAGPVH